MTEKELNEAIEELRSKGMTDEDIVAGMGKMFEQGEISKEELRALIAPMGYKFKADFEEKGDEESKESLWDTDPKEKDDDVTDAEVDESEDAESGDQREATKGESEEDERKRAFSAMGLDD